MKLTKSALPVACRPGLAAVWMLVVLAVLTIMMSAMTWQFLAGRHFLNHRHHQLQAVWLARAGLDLAADHLLTNPAGYTGETLEILPGSQVHIEVRKEDGTSDTYQVTSEAHYPQEGPEVVGRSLSVRWRRVQEKDRVRLEGVAAGASEKEPKPNKSEED